MIPNLIDEAFTRYPLLWSTEVASEAVDVTALFGGAPSRWVSCVDGDLVVVDVFGTQHVIYSAEWEARSMQRLQITAVLPITTDEALFPSPVSTTATYVRVYGP